MTASTITQQQKTLEKTVAGKTVTLTPEQAEAFGRELDALKERVIADFGERDTTYIRRIIKAQRGLEIAGRALLFGGIFPPFWLAGTAMLGVSKILDNMEIGHNVMHGQYDWTGDPALSSKNFEWDTACPADQWRHSHNYMHHTYTNIVGMDRDVGYGILRMSEGPEVATVLPGQSGVCIPADGAVPVRRRVARDGDRADHGRRDLAFRQARDPRGHLAQDQEADAEGLRGVPAAGRAVRAVGAGRATSPPT